MADACNIGYEPLINKDIPALTASRLKWVKQNYYRTETILESNAKLVNTHSRVPLVKVWGGGEVASADGMRLVTPIRTAYSRPNRKYFRAEQGVTFYNYLSNQFSGFHGFMIPGTMRDSIYLLQGIIEQQSNLKLQEVMTDTAGASQIVFALFWLLGYQFSPRLADAGSIRLWRMDKSADYGELNEFTKNVISVKRIENEWDTYLRVAGSLTMGTISASELIRTLLSSKNPSSLFKSLRELGRIVQTNHLLKLFNDERQQRRILTQLNRGESRHSLARAVFHGNRGDMRQKYREGQEDQIGALGLMLNVIVLWNTLYIQQALEYLRSNGHEVKDEDVARVSPLIFEHINFLGRYFFVTHPSIREGHLRPLRSL
jgi:TnpA family transposase